MWAREVLEVRIGGWFQLIFQGWAGFEEVDKREEGTPGSVDGDNEGREDELYIFWRYNKETILSGEAENMGVEIRLVRKIGQEQPIDYLKCQFREVNFYPFISLCFLYFRYLRISFLTDGKQENQWGLLWWAQR